jgi:hypothetical protein
MADLGPLTKPSRKGEPPKPVDTMPNLSKPASGAKMPLQMKIPSEMRKEFKQYALAHDIDASTLFEMVWQYYKEHHG